MMRIAVLLADGFEEIEAITAIDFLRRAGVDVPIVGVNGVVATGGHAIRVESTLPVADVDDLFISSLDGVIVPGGTGGAENIAASNPAVDIIRACLDGGKLVAAICAAPGLVLGDHNLLTGRRFTCYPGFETHISGGHFSEDRVVVDGNVITSRGPGTAAEFSIAIVRYLVGEEPAADLQRATLQPA